MTGAARASPHAGAAIAAGYPSPCSRPLADQWQNFFAAAADGGGEQAFQYLLGAVASGHRGTCWPALPALLPSRRIALSADEACARSSVLRVLSTLSCLGAEQAHELFQPPGSAQRQPLRGLGQQGAAALAAGDPLRRRG